MFHSTETTLLGIYNDLILAIDRGEVTPSEDGLYSKEELEETMSTLRARFPTMNFYTIDPRFMHPFTAVIAGPSQSGKSMFCMRLIRNAQECKILEISPNCLVNC